jgi:hypothetical protein
MTRNLLILGLIVVLVAGFATAYLLLTPEEQREDMGMRAPNGEANLPPVRGYAEGAEIAFVHPEASDAEIADLLTEMMGSPVLVVPALAEAPESMLATVYVFANGIEGEGPLGYQPDVFDAPPGSKGYSPLRALNRVSWVDPDTARELRSAAEVQAAEASGKVTIEQPGVVVNMPIVLWPDGER